jgi:hypothetical protein
MRKSENRIEAERLMRTPEYYRDRDPDLIERVNRMFQGEVGTGLVSKSPPKSMGGKENPL